MDQYLDQAVNEYNAGLHIPVTPLPAVPKREIGAAKAEVVQAATSAQESADVFENIARALERGQQKKLLTLCQQALDEGHERGLQDQIKVMVGGAPISQSFCDEIGADYYAEDAGAAAREAVKILKVQKAS